MKIKMNIKQAALVLLGAFALNSHAAIEWNDYSEKAYKEASESGKTVVIGLHKKGCGTCAAQDQALEDAGLKEKKNVVFLKAERKDKADTKVFEKYGLQQRQNASIVLEKNKKVVKQIKPGDTTSISAIDLVSRIH